MAILPDFCQDANIVKECIKFNFMENQENTIEDSKKSGIAKKEIIFLLVLGFLVGAVIKTEAAKRITIGFEDYKAKNFEQAYDFEKIQKELKEKFEAQSKQQDQQQNQ